MSHSDFIIADPESPITEKQLGKLFALFRQKGFTDLRRQQWLARHFAVGTVEKLRKGKACDAIRLLEAEPDPVEPSGSLF